jgi:adenosylmethionine-8-amino-7-oxononanoate aminotransferase
LREHADELTAVVVEPIVQCAGRMTMTGAGFYRRLAAEAQQLGIHVIADEIAVGFGRTGRLFASEWSGVTPDLMCVSKALSGGFLPLAATLIRAGFEDDFAGDPARSFLHSHTYTANPIACAAALAGLDLFTEHAGPGGLAAGLGPGVERIIARIEVLRHELADRCPAVLEHRQAGTIAALRVGPRSRGPATGRSSLHLRRAALARGVLLRPLHDTIYWMPPMCIDDDELSLLARATGDAIEEVFG